MNSLSKAALIRAAFSELGEAADFKAIDRWLKAKNVDDVSPQQVSNERRKLRPRYDVEDLPVSVLRKVKTIVDAVGSTDVVRRALDELDALSCQHRCPDS